MENSLLSQHGFNYAIAVHTERIVASRCIPLLDDRNNPRPSGCHLLLAEMHVIHIVQLTAQPFKQIAVPGLQSFGG